MHGSGQGGDGTVPAIPAGGYSRHALRSDAGPGRQRDDDHAERTVPAFPVPDRSEPVAAEPVTAEPVTAEHPVAGPPAGPPAGAAPEAADPSFEVDPAFEVDAPAPPPPGERLALTPACGPTLRERTVGDPLPVRHVVRIGTDLATVLAHLHHRGRAHGAVTTSNVLLTPGGQVQLVDVEGGERARPADDVHDLGAALTAALTGSDAGAVPTDIPRALRRVLLAATETDPDRRPTARQVVDMLAWVGRDEPVAEPEPLWGVSRTAAWAFGGAALLVALLVLGGVALLRGDPVPAAAPPAPTTTAAPSESPIPTVAPTASDVAPAPTTTVTEPTVAPPPTPPTALPTELPTGLPTGLPTAVPTQLPDLGLPTALPELPDLPDAQGLWDRIVEWFRGLF